METYRHKDTECKRPADVQNLALASTVQRRPSGVGWDLVGQSRAVVFGGCDTVRENRDRVRRSRDQLRQRSTLSTSMFAVRDHVGQDKKPSALRRRPEVETVCAEVAIM